MKAIFLAAGIAAALSTSAFALDPIPGSLIYPTQPRTKVTKAPIGSPLTHTFHDESGRKVTERYRILPDRSLQLTHRSARNR